MSDKKCSVPGCPNAGKIVRSMCDVHYRRWRKYGDPNVKHKPGRAERATGCSVPGCDRPHKGLGLCNRHYMQQYKASKNAPTDLSPWHVTCGVCGAALGTITDDGDPWTLIDQHEHIRRTA